MVEVQGFLFFTIIITIIVAIFVVGASMTDVIQQIPEEYVNFAKCITASGAKLYITTNCYSCDIQKDTFGIAWNNVNYIDCSNELNSRNCRDTGINSYPTWTFSEGIKYSGRMTLKELSERTGCTLPSI